MIRTALVSTTIAAVALASPCRASDDVRMFAEPAARPAAFMGGVLRLQLGERNQVMPIARLRLGMNPVGGGVSRSPGREQNSGIELGFGRTGQANLYVGGQNAAELRRRLGIGDSGRDTVLIIFGVALVVVGVVVIAGLEDLGDGFEGR